MPDTLAVEGPPVTPTAGVDNPHHLHRWSILIVLALAQLMVVLDTTVVNIALPSAQRDLGFSNTDRQWIVTAYALAFGSLLLLGGRLSDLFGRKRMFVIGLIGFAAASAVGGASTDFAMLTAARAVQGAFGAMLTPAALSLLNTTFTKTEERSKAFGIYGAVAGGGGAVGLLLGGALTEYLSWRWCMYVNLIFATAALVGAWRLLTNQRAPIRPRMDLQGVLLVVSGLFLVVYGFARAETVGWLQVSTLACIGAGVLTLTAFVLRQSRTDHPLLPLRVVRSRNRGGALIAILLTGAAMFGLFLFLTYYLQTGLGYSAVLTGVAFLPMVGTLMLTSISSSQLLAGRVSPKWIISAGMLIAAIGMVLLTRIDVTSSYPSQILPGLVVAGAGIGLVFSSAMSNASLGLLAEDQGVGSAMTTVAQQIGGSLGTALLNTLFASAVSAYVLSHGRATEAVHAAGAVHGYVVVFWISAAVFAAGGVVCGLVLTRTGPQPVADLETQPAR